MTFDVDETCNIAARLINKEPNEAGYRASTSRAYYSAYHEACKVAKKYGYKPQSTKFANFQHKVLSNKLTNHPSSAANFSGQNKNINKLGRMLRNAYDLRCKADYQDTAKYSCREAKDAVQESRAIISLAKNL